MSKGHKNAFYGAYLGEFLWKGRIKNDKRMYHRCQCHEDLRIAIPTSPFNKGHHQCLTCSLRQMANPRPTKCQRPDPGTSYHDPVPVLDDNFNTIHSREGRLKRVSRGIGTATLPRDPHHGTSWNSVYSWDPPDDFKFALDPDGDLYDDLVEGDIMEEHLSSDNPSKKKRSRVSVGLFILFSLNWMG